jgi:DNA-directed RNA polymerase specialized sigma24 family protein
VRAIVIKMRQRGEIGPRPAKLRPERPARRKRNPDRHTRRIALAAEECASIVERYQRRESCRSIAKRFAHSPDVIARVLREAGTDLRNRRIVFTDEERASIAARYQQGESCGLIAKTFSRHPGVITRVLREAGIALACRSVSPSQREQVRDLWMAGLPYAEIGEHLDITERRVGTILTKMRQCGEIGVRPVALRSLQVRRPARLPANAIPAVLLQMAQGMSYSDIARHWQMSRGEMYGFLTELRRRKSPVDPTLPPAVTIIRPDQVPALLLQTACGAPKTEIARQWRVNPKALYGFLQRQSRRPIGATT